MPVTFHESNIDWEFEAGWLVMQYDDSTWYRKHFNACAESAAVDFLAMHPDKQVGWLIEVKDFTTEPPATSKDLVQIITKKVRDTLAGALVGAANANTTNERAVFRAISAATSFRVAFHCERPSHPSKLFRSLPDPADLRQKLKSALRAVDTKVLVLDTTSTPNMSVPWKAAWNPK